MAGNGDNVEQFGHLRALPDGSLTRAEVGVLLDHLAEVVELRHQVMTCDAEALRVENKRLRAVLTDAAYLARLARGSSWPGDMAERVERAAERVIRAADNGRTEESDA